MQNDGSDDDGLVILFSFCFKCSPSRQKSPWSRVKTFLKAIYAATGTVFFFPRLIMEILVSYSRDFFNNLRKHTQENKVDELSFNREI